MLTIEHKAPTVLIRISTTIGNVLNKIVNYEKVYSSSTHFE
jgi:hypothetical protein